MDLNEYIKMSYKRPNRKVLEGLGASEDLIEYLMETPGNTNWNVINSVGESGNDDWTVIRLNAVELLPEEQPGVYVLQGNAADYEALLNLSNRDDLIMAVSYDCSYYGTNISNSDDVYYLADASMSNYFDGPYLHSTPMGAPYTGHVVVPEVGINYYGSAPDIDIGSTSWAEIRYKVGTHYTITATGNRPVSWNMEPGQKWITPKEFTNYKLTDGVNTWNFGDTIIPTSDMNLTIVRN